MPLYNLVVHSKGENIMIPDYTNLKMNLEGLNTFFQDNGVKISAEDREKINSIFKECDIAGANNEQKADGELTGQ